jgi:nitroimidazol reductase NimA-like FMN-containing flavoprotein (pyridoxamine 5'-phosphate oxidase superfamily)
MYERTNSVEPDKERGRPAMLEEIEALIKKSDLCVLSTVSGGGPHCSLMSYVTDDDCREFYMITLPATKKYRNLEDNSAASLLIDTREDDADRRRRDIRALTVRGVFRRIDEKGEERAILQKLLQRHPHLKEFAENGEAKVFAVRAKSFQLLEGVSRSFFVELP